MRILAFSEGALWDMCKWFIAEAMRWILTKSPHCDRINLWS